jgi:hypothetical protein
MPAAAVVTGIVGVAAWRGSSVEWLDKGNFRYG